MGQDYSYSQPSSSSTSLLGAEDKLYADEADSGSCNAEAVQYQPQPEADEGIPLTCYCGSEPFVDCSYSRKHPYRRYFTCQNAEDGECHVWKWWDVAVVEELRDFQRELRQVKTKANDNDMVVKEEVRDIQRELWQLQSHAKESEQKLLNLEKTLKEFSEKKSGAKLKLVVCLLVLMGLVLLILPGVYMNNSKMMFLGIQNDVRDRGIHEQLKNDLIEHIWNKFGDVD